jgi:pyridoxamine 5'-phosphate oxidase
VHSPEHAPIAIPEPEHDAVDVAGMRRHYSEAGLDETGLAADPMAQFARWLADVERAGITEPNAMVVSTVDAEGQPSTRTVLLKGYDRQGFVFYTNYGSRKGGDLAVNPRVALLFPWHPVARQVTVTGLAERVGRDETGAYFRSRPHGSRLGAWASEQSRPVGSREELEQRYAELAARYPEGAEVPVPPFWGGYRVTPRTVEFWQGRENRLHDRFRYERAEDGWSVQRLCP